MTPSDPRKFREVIMQDGFEAAVRISGG